MRLALQHSVHIFRTYGYYYLHRPKPLTTWPATVRRGHLHNFADISVYDIIVQKYDIIETKISYDMKNNILLNSSFICDIINIYMTRCLLYVYDVMFWYQVGEIEYNDIVIMQWIILDMDACSCKVTSQVGLNSGSSEPGVWIILRCCTEQRNLHLPQSCPTMYVHVRPCTSMCTFMYFHVLQCIAMYWKSTYSYILACNFRYTYRYVLRNGHI